MTREELNTICTKISTDKQKSSRFDFIKNKIIELRDAAVLPTTKAIYDEILDLFDVVG